MKRLLFLPGLFFLLIQFTTAAPELTGSPNELGDHLNNTLGTITLEAESEVRVEADQATVVVSIQTEHKLLKSALEINQRKRADIVEKLKQSGVATNRMLVAKFATGENLGFFSGKTRTHEVISHMEITAESEKEIQTIAGISDQDEEVATVSIVFNHSQKEVHRRNALEKALTFLNAEKSTYEQGLNVKLVPKAAPSAVVHAITQGARFQTKTGSLPAKSYPQAISPSHFNSMTYTASVQVIYRIVPAE